MSDDLAHLEHCANKATKGRWYAMGTWVENEKNTQPDIVCTPHNFGRGTGDSYERREADANYIAAAQPVVIKGLISEIRKLRADGARLKWLMRNVSGKEFRRLGVVYDAGCKAEDIDQVMRK